MEVRFTPHLRERLHVLQQQGFDLTEKDIEQAVRNPDRVVPGYGGRLISQKALTGRHLLRVVYEQQADVVVCITVYPGRRTRYEHH